MKLLEYILPILTAIIIAVFYMCMPDVRLTRLTIKKRSFKKEDLLCCLSLTLVYAVTAFVNLGNSFSPQSFAEFCDGEDAVLELKESGTVDSVEYFTGVTVGSFRIDVSEDGWEYSELVNCQIGYDGVLKWQQPELPEKSPNAVKYIRIVGLAGSSRLGELSVTVNGERAELIPVNGASAQALCDEQDTVPEYPSYMNSSYFDEIYHVRTAQEHIERRWPYEISHPPLGKIILSMGIRLFGLTPLGWRFTGTLFGVLMVPAMYMFLFLMFKDTLVAGCASALLATDFMHYTQTRIATIDSYAVFFIILMYLFMYKYIMEEDRNSLALSGLFFGIGCACKWTCIYAGAGLGVIWLFYWLHRLFTKAERKKDVLRKFVGNIGFCLVFFLFVPAVIYYLSYIPYGLTENMQFPGMLFTGEYAELVADNQAFMLTYHMGVKASHPYSSVWYQWVLDIRPILYYLQYFDDGTRSSFGAFVNPALCWGGLIAVQMLVVIAVCRKDKTAAFIVVGYLAQLLPWVFIKRILFEYHYFACTVFLVLAMGYVFSLMKENKRGKWFCIGYAAFSTCLFALFYPAISGSRIDNSLATRLLGWLPTWPF